MNSYPICLIDCLKKLFLREIKTSGCLDMHVLFAD
jgi:hypothetical protein